MRTRAFNFRLDEQTHADILAMAEHVGKPGNLTAGLCGVFAQWRRWKAERDAAPFKAAWIAQWEEHLDALEQHDEAEGRC